MAAPAWLSAAIGGGTGLAAPLISGAMQSKRDHDAKSFALQQGDIDWQHQLDAFNMQNRRDDETWNRQNDYNLQMWEKQNNYNSPAAQMQRYKEAGLNPNLIYGQSNTGGSIATANLESGSIHGGGRPGDWKPHDAPDFSGAASALGGMMSQMLDFKAKSAQIDNVRAATDVYKEDALMKSAQTAMTIAQNTGVNIDNRSKEFDYGLKSDLRQTSVDAARAALQRVRIESDVALARNEREAAMNAQNLRKGAEEVLNLRGMRMNTALDTMLKKLDYDRKKMGMPGTEMLNRMLGRFLGPAAKSLDYLMPND